MRNSCTTWKKKKITLVNRNYDLFMYLFNSKFKIYYGE